MVSRPPAVPPSNRKTIDDNFTTNSFERSLRIHVLIGHGKYHKTAYDITVLGKIQINEWVVVFNSMFNHKRLIIKMKMYETELESGIGDFDVVHSCWLFYVYVIIGASTEDPRYNDSVCYQRLCCKIEFAVIKELDRTHLKHQ